MTKLSEIIRREAREKAFELLLVIKEEQKKLEEINAN